MDSKRRLPSSKLSAGSFERRLKQSGRLFYRRGLTSIHLCPPINTRKNDTQDYDLIVEKENKLQRVQVKSTGCIGKGRELSSCT